MTAALKRQHHRSKSTLPPTHSFNPLNLRPSFSGFFSEPSRCMFHQQNGRTLVQGGHVHVQGSAVTREECEQACVHHSDFTCRSFEFDPGSNLCLPQPRRFVFHN
ncbi:apple domain-containing protein [Caerostris extrusa]|uniref:Apple domain-containing protein n=1 Tax=Caerostris extrusa TaxID=172846 RepID=A0AAV4NJH3_CAEEX|nr:apple domain-containing protein [Caerostris extrusa]